MLGSLILGGSPLGSGDGFMDALAGAVVSHRLELPDGSVPRRANIEIRLVGAGYPWSTIEGYSPGALSVGGIARPQIDSTGTWTATLAPNSSIFPAGTVYEVRERFGGREAVLFISVGPSGGHVEDLLTASPA